MSNQKPPRKHHYLPKFYLRRFSIHGDGIFRIAKQTGEVTGGPVKDTAAMRDFHILDGDDIADRYALERELGEVVETKMARYLADFLNGAFHDYATQRYVMQFVSMMRMRVPAVREHILKSKGAQIKALLIQMEKQGKLPAVPAGLEHVLSADQLSVEVTNMFCMEQMYRLASDEDVLQIFYRMRLTLLHAPFGDRFVTSDQPVALFHPTDATVVGIGPDTEGVVISLALSSGAALLLERRSGPDIERNASSAEVLEINRRTILLSQQRIFTGEAPEQLLPVIDSVRGTSAGFTFDRVTTQHHDGFLLRYVGIGPAKIPGEAKVPH